MLKCAKKAKCTHTMTLTANEEDRDAWLAVNKEVPLTNSIKFQSVSSLSLVETEAWLSSWPRTLKRPIGSSW